jgi:lipoate-protein ligase A
MAEIEAATALRPLVRRTTGGGLVPHDLDWTYSVAMPPDHPWYELRASESYERVHRWIQSALALRGVVTELAPCCRKEIPGQCFAGYEKSDVLCLGRKIAGAAQRLWPPSIARESWRGSMQVSAARDWGTVFRAWLPSGDLSDRANQLATGKYSRDDYNRRR